MTKRVGSAWYRTLKYIAWVVLALPALTAVSGAAHGAGFALREQSGSALGNAFAGATAGAEDVSYMFFNPAGLTRHSGYQAALSISYVGPRGKLESASGSTITGATISGTSTIDDVAEDGVLPALYGFFDFHPDFKAGIGINVPFGLETDYVSDWVGRYHALNSRLLIINVNPAAAYRVNDWLSLGAGLQISYTDVRLTNAIDFGTIGFVQTGGAIGVPGQEDGHAKVEGDDVGFGFNLGVLLEPNPGTRFGVAYRSKIDHEVTGNAEFRLDSAGTAATLQGLAAGMGNPVPFVDTGASASIQLPETASFGVYHDIDDKWSVMAEAAWTRWSRFKELRVRFDNPGQPDNVTDARYHDSWFVALGATYRWSDAWTFRAGTAYDESPVPDETRTPRIADEDRYWISLGASYIPIPDLTIDLSYAHNFIEDSAVNLTTNGNTFRGNLSANYSNTADLLALQLIYRF